MDLFLFSFESVTGMPVIVGYVFVFLFGAAVGSFLNVVIHRAPLEQSIAPWIRNSSARWRSKSPPPLDRYGAAAQGAYLRRRAGQRRPRRRDRRDDHRDVRRPG